MCTHRDTCISSGVQQLVVFVKGAVLGEVTADKLPNAKVTIASLCLILGTNKRGALSFVADSVRAAFLCQM